MSDEPNTENHEAEQRRPGIIARLARQYLPSHFCSADAEAAIGADGLEEIHGAYGRWVAEQLRDEEARDIAAKNTPRGRS